MSKVYVFGAKPLQRSFFERHLVKRRPNLCDILITAIRQRDASARPMIKEVMLVNYWKEPAANVGVQPYGFVEVGFNRFQTDFFSLENWPGCHVKVDEINRVPYSVPQALERYIACSMINTFDPIILTRPEDKELKKKIMLELKHQGHSLR